MSKIMEGISPLPWKVSGKQTIRGIDGSWVAKTFWNRGPETAAYIVHAANLYPELVEALEGAETQIQYLHDKFQETGSGNAELARIRTILAKCKAGAE
jgi:hypothetical protein